MITLHRDGGRAWLEGVTGWSWRNRRSSIHAAQAAVMEALGEAVSYEHLVGVSALAFRMQLSKEGFCPSSPNAFCGYQCVARSTESLPWKVLVCGGKPEGEEESTGEIRRAIVDSIDRGVPVQYGREEDGIIVGYQKGGEEWLCFHPERDDGKTIAIETTLGWGVAIFTARREERPERGALAMAAFQQAIRMAGARRAGGYFVGHDAWDEYIARLENYDAVNGKASRDAILGNAWIYVCLAHHRACAASYLRDVAGVFPAVVAGVLEKAADLYDAISMHVLTDDGQVLTGLWTGEAFREQVKRLQHALPLERRAIAALVEAIGLAGQRSSAA
ncbi:MAG: hypothetical protein HY820_23145 [Acidobacteria bacterium]|nr:hypothetical protein [Acidobacteriota bacterium]